MTDDIYRCPKCNCGIIYWDDEIGKCACQKCGTRFPARIKDTLQQEENEMALDKQRLVELHSLGLRDKEIAESMKEKQGTVWAARKAMGLPANNPKNPRKEKVVKASKPKQEKTVSHETSVKTDFIVTSSGSALDMLINERNNLQERVFKLNQAIELLS